MFFCLNLVFAESNTRVIKEEDTADIVVNCGDVDYVLTNAIIDPESKGNINTYIFKDNVPVKFSFANMDIELGSAYLRNYYYRTIKNKKAIIRCIDREYTSGEEIYFVPMQTYQILKATNRLNGCLFICDYTYKVKNIEEPKRMKFAFMIVPEKEYKMYEDIETVRRIEEENENEIKRPRKHE